MGRRVGIVGHRELAPEPAAWAANELAELLEAETAVEVVTSLVEGAQQTCANLAVAKALALTVVLPSDNYEKTFAAGLPRKEYFRLMSLARDVIRLPFELPSDGAVLEAGKAMIRRCDVLFAVWNGQPTRPPDLTSAVIDYARQYGRRYVHVDPVARAVTLSAPRPVAPVKAPETGPEPESQKAGVQAPPRFKKPERGKARPATPAASSEDDQDYEEL